MAITKEKKNQITEKLASIAKNSESVVFANFHGLGVEDASELRSGLRAQGVSYYVAKKSLLRRAFENGDIKGDMPDLEGEIAVAYGDDALAPAREVGNFAKKHEASLSLVGGVFDGEFRNRESIMEIAMIPSIDGLRGMFANVINSPIQRFVIALGQITETKS